jgi:hypothetical protein
MPVMTPKLKNSPITLFVQKEATISPIPAKIPPIASIVFDPNLRIKLALMIAKMDKHATANEPTKANVEGGARPSETS